MLPVIFHILHGCLLSHGLLRLGDAEKKSIESQQPIYRITVITYRRQEACSDIMGNDRIKTVQINIDSDRLLGKTEEQDELFIMRYFDIDPLIKKRSYFFPPIIFLFDYCNLRLTMAALGSPAKLAPVLRSPSGRGKRRTAAEPRAAKINLHGVNS